MSDQNQAVDPNAMPEGWTPRMQSYEGGAPETPSYEEAATSNNNNTPAPEATPNPQAAPADQNSTPPEPVGDEAKYWRDIALGHREDIAKLKPLEAYGSLIEYLDKNEDAANLVLAHMQGVKGEAGTPQGDLERELYGDDNTNNDAGNVARQRPTGHADDPNVRAKQHMYNEVQRLMQEQGIPSHDADMHLKFMLTPGEISPQEMLEMYRTLSASRGKPIGGTPQGQSPQSNVPPVVANPEPAKEISAGKNGMPPPSVTGISGDNANPNTMPNVSTSKDRLAYDPNNA